MIIGFKGKALYKPWGLNFLKKPFVWIGWFFYQISWFRPSFDYLCTYSPHFSPLHNALRPGQNLSHSDQILIHSDQILSSPHLFGLVSVLFWLVFFLSKFPGFGSVFQIYGQTYTKPCRSLRFQREGFCGYGRFHSNKSIYPVKKKR